MSHPGTRGVCLCARVSLWLVGAVLIVSITSCGAASSGSTAPKTTPSPTTDPALQSYAVAVHTYYQPFSDAIESENNSCRIPVPTPWTTCQSLTAVVEMTGQALLAHLPATPPPAQVQTMDTALKQAVQAEVSAYMKRAPDVAAHNTDAFTTDNAAIDQAVLLQCEPIKQFNAVAPANTHIEAPHGECPVSY